MTILTVQLTVEFSKRLPGFDTLLREDQITLLKACSSEVMMLRCARRYDANTDSIVFANNLPYTRESYNMAGVGDTADSLFRFGKTMSLMKVDNAEYALLTAIVIFSGMFFFYFVLFVFFLIEIYIFLTVSGFLFDFVCLIRTTGIGGGEKGGKDPGDLPGGAAGLRDEPSGAADDGVCQTLVGANRVAHARQPQL